MADEELEEESALSSIKEHLTHLGTKVDHLKDTVKEHITKDKQYYSVVDNLVDTKEEGTEMEDSAGLIAAMLAGRNNNGEGGGALGGAGGGFAGAALGSLLLGRGGVAGGAVVGEGCVTPSQLTAALAGVQDTQMNTAVLQTLGAIQGAIPLAEGQVQLALAGAVGEVRSHLGAVENGLVAGQAAINKNISDGTAATLALGNNINMNIMTMGQANLVATKDAQYANAIAVAASTKEILAALNTNVIADLQRQLTVAESRAQEDRLVGRQRETEINISNTNTAVAQQQQSQQQQQQQAILLSNLCHIVGGLQTAVATNSNMIIGNTGATTTGPQTSNPVNVRT